MKNESLKTMRLTVILVLIFNAFLLNAQDSTVYIQSEEAMMNNKYVFYSDSTFRHYLYSGGQVWYGEGNWYDEGNARHLDFETDRDRYDFPGASYSGVVHYETRMKRTFQKEGDKLIADDIYNTRIQGNAVFRKRSDIKREK